MSALYSPESVLTETLLEEENAYRYFLEASLDFYTQIQSRDLSKIHKEALTDNLHEQMVKYRKILEERYTFLVTVLEGNISIFIYVVKDFLFSPFQVLPEGFSTVFLKELIGKDTGIYKLEGDKIIIEDPELDLHIQAPFSAVQKMTQDRHNGWFMLFYPDGQVKTECVYQRIAPRAIKSLLKRK